MLYSIKVKILTSLVKIASKVVSGVFKVEVPPVPSVAAIIEKNGKILAIDLTYKKGYALPGGVLKGNENFTTAIKREIKEETGLTVTWLKFYNTFTDTSQFPKVVVVYLVKVKGNLRKGSNEGSTEWVAPEILIKNMAYKDNLTAIKSYLRENKHVR